jgi:phage gp45-like
MNEDDVREIVRQELYHLFFGSASGSVSNGEQDGTGRAGEQMTGVPLCQHYGFASAPPADTERLYAETMAGTVSIAERSTSRPSLNAGQSALYDENGGIIKLLNSSGARKGELGATASQYDIAYANSLEAKASPVTVSALMTTWMSQVAVFINGLAAGTVAPPAVSGIGFVSAGSTKYGVES